MHFLHIALHSALACARRHQILNSSFLPQRDDEPWYKISTLKVVQELRKESSVLKDSVDRLHSTLCKAEDAVKASTSEGK